MTNLDVPQTLCRPISGEDPSRVRELRINCPDVTGLGADVFRLLLDFGLRILKADITTDGTWCLIVLVVALSPGAPPRWQLLKARLVEVCPSDTDSFFRLLCPATPKKCTPYAVHVSTAGDRQGMLHSLSHALWEADTSVFKAHVTTAPSGEIRDTFWLYDNRNELPQPHRVLEICDRVKGALGPGVVCEIEPAPVDAGESFGHGVGRSHFGSVHPLDTSPGGTGAAAHPTLRRMACKDIASSNNLRNLVGNRKKEPTSSGAPSAPGSTSSSESGRMPPSKSLSGRSSQSSLSQKQREQQPTEYYIRPNSPESIVVEVDNAASSSHTLLTLHCKDRKGLMYDLLLKLKEIEVRLAFGRVDVDPDTGECVADLYVQDSEFSRIEDPELVSELTERIREAATLPVRIAVQDVMEGAATELTVAANVDVGGRGRPRVTFDVTQGLCAAGLGVACADVYVEEQEVPASPNAAGTTATMEEIHRFLVHMPQGGGLETAQDRNALIEVVRASLLGVRTPQGPVARLSGAAAAAEGGGSGVLSALPRVGSGLIDNAGMPPMYGGGNVTFKGQHSSLGGHTHNTTAPTAPAFTTTTTAPGRDVGRGRTPSPALLRSMSENWKGS